MVHISIQNVVLLDLTNRRGGEDVKHLILLQAENWIIDPISNWNIELLTLKNQKFFYQLYWSQAYKQGNEMKNLMQIKSTLQTEDYGWSHIISIR